jgi:hypothetical protein
MEMRGRRIVEAAGAYWHSVEGDMYMSIPSHLALDPDPRELDDTLRSVRAVGARFPTRTWAGSPSGLYVCRRRDFDLDKIARQSRRRIRRGLERCEIRPVESGELLEQGLQLNLDSMRRQGRFDPEFGERKQWKRLVAAVDKSPALSAVGAFVNGRLAAYAITCREDGWLHILHGMTRPSEMPNCPSPALHFHITRQVALDPSLEAVSAGLVSLVELPGLHEFKLRMGYELLPMRSAIHLHPRLAALMTSAPALGLVKAFRRLRPRDQRLERVSAVLIGARRSRMGLVSTQHDGVRRGVPA